MAAPFLILTGASGSGKTTLAHAVQDQHPACQVFFFDTIGVPSPEETAKWGPGHEPGGAWQRAMTLEWIGTIAGRRDPTRPLLFEGQVRIAFLQEALALHGITSAQILLVDCYDETRAHRLTHDRRQPDLANDSMMNWGRYLRAEAEAAHLPILESSQLSFQESFAVIRAYLYPHGIPAVPLVRA